MRNKIIKLLPAALLVLIGCTYNTLEPPVNCTATNLSLVVISKQDAKCNQSNGNIKVMATGGSGIYKFSINKGPLQESDTFQQLVAGSYKVEVVDKTCTASVTVDLINQDGLNISIVSTESGCSTNGGSIRISTTGGTPPFTFGLNGGTMTSTSEYLNLGHGNYNVVAKDGVGCEVKQTVNLKSGVSYTASVAGIIQTNCAISGCHVAGAQPPNFTMLSNIQSNAVLIKTRTGNKSMPLGRTLTQTEINTIACWVDDGALNN